MSEDLIVPKAELRVLQIINAALVGGVAVFLAYALFSQLVGQPRNQPGMEFLSWLGLAALAGGLAAGRIAGNQIEEANLRRILSGAWTSPNEPPPDREVSFECKLLSGKQKSHIARLALIEGPAFIAGVAYLTAGSLLGLAVALLALVFLIAYFPTEGRLRRWLEAQAERMQQRRQQSN